MVSQIEAGHYDAETASASVDRHCIADNKPYTYRTHDGGKTWQNVVAATPDSAYVNAVKEDNQPDEIDPGVRRAGFVRYIS